MILKWVGGTLLIGSCWLIGYSLSLNLQIRKQSLQELRSALLELKSQMGYMGTDLVSSFAEIGANIKSPVGEMLIAFSKKLSKGASVTETWNKAVDGAAYDMALSQEDKCLVKGFGKLLGNSDIDGQVSNIELTASRIERQILEAEDKEKRLGVIYKYAGAAAGLALTLLLI